MQLERILGFDLRSAVPRWWWFILAAIGVTLLWIVVGYVLITAFLEFWVTGILMWLAASATISFLGMWRLRSMRRRAQLLGEGICPRCKYELRGTRSVRCPECNYWHGRRFDRALQRGPAAARERDNGQ